MANKRYCQTNLTSHWLPLIFLNDNTKHLQIFQDFAENYPLGGDVAICALLFSKRLNLLSYARQRCGQAVSQTVVWSTICVDLTQMMA